MLLISIFVYFYLLLFVKLLRTRVLGLPESTEIDQRPDKKFRQNFIGVLLQQQQTGSLLLALSLRED